MRRSSCPRPSEPVSGAVVAGGRRLHRRFHKRGNTCRPRVCQSHDAEKRGLYLKLRSRSRRGHPSLGCPQAGRRSPGSPQNTAAHAQPLRFVTRTPVPAREGRRQAAPFEPARAARPTEKRPDFVIPHKVHGSKSFRRQLCTCLPHFWSFYEALDLLFLVYNLLNLIELKYGLPGS